MADNYARLRDARDLLLDLREDYATACATFQWPAMEGRFCWATDWFDRIGRDNPQPALRIRTASGDDTSLTYAELVDRSDRVATWLAQHGVAKGSRVLLMLGNRVEMWESMLGVMKLGGVILPTTTALGPTDLADRLDRGAVSHVIAAEGDCAKFDGFDGLTKICVDDAPAGWLAYSEWLTVQSAGPFEAVTETTDALLLYFTSGTTSRPKLVQHTQVSYPVGHLSTMYWIGVRPGDVHMTIASPGWAKHAWSCFFTPFLAEATVFVYDTPRFEAEPLLAELKTAQVNTFCAPPTVWRLLLQADLSTGPGSLREVLAAGEPLNPEVISQVQKHWGLTVRDGFGQTETTAQVANSPGQPIVPGAMGLPLPGVPVRLVDPITGEEANDEGEICLALGTPFPGLMTGYVDDQTRNDEAMAGGHYHTGDVAQRDADGRITYIGRTDDVFKASDYKVSPFEVESVLIEHPAVVEAAVVPAPDPLRLAATKAYVTLATSHSDSEQTARDILTFCREKLAPHLRVRRLEVVAELPKTVSGKIRRVELRTREQELFDSGAEAPGEWRDDRLGLRPGH
jgi:acetyl-CoA synthetase